jgi:hypothetical protein
LSQKEEREGERREREGERGERREREIKLECDKEIWIEKET